MNELLKLAVGAHGGLEFLEAGLRHRGRPEAQVESFALTRCVRDDRPLSIPDANGLAVTPVIVVFHRSNRVGLAYTRKRVVRRSRPALKIDRISRGPLTSAD